MIAYPYGYKANGKSRCINVEPGAFNHECGKPARNIGIKYSGARAMFCDECRAAGTEAKQFPRWTKLEK